MYASGGSVNGNQQLPASDYLSIEPSDGNATEGSRYRQLRPAPATGHLQASQSNTSASNAALGQRPGPLSQANYVPEPDGFHQCQDPEPNAIPRWLVGSRSQLGQNTFVPWTAGPLNQVARTVDLVNHLLQQHPNILASISSVGDSQLLQPQVELLGHHPLSGTPGSFLAIVIPIHHQPAPTPPTAPAPAPAPTPTNGEQRQQADADRELTDPKTGQFVCPYDGKQSTSPSELIMHLRRQHQFKQVKYTVASDKRKAPNYIEKPETSTTPWCALCTWCYKAFTTKEQLNEHIRYHRSKTVKENTFTRLEKIGIIWDLVHPGRRSSNGHQHVRNANKVQDAPAQGLQQRQAHRAAGPLVDGPAVPEHPGPEGASSSSALPDFHFMGAKFDGPDRADPTSLMPYWLDFSQHEMQGTEDVEHQQRRGYVNPRDLELNRL